MAKKKQKPSKATDDKKKVEQKNQKDEAHVETGDDEAVKNAAKKSLIVLAAIIALGGIGYGVYNFWTKDNTPIEDVKSTRKARVRATVSDVPTIKFTDITDSCGVDFVHTNGDVGKKLLPQTMGGGVAFIDFDNDGDQDLFFVNSNYWAGDQPPNKPKPTMQLYENDGTGKFENATKKAGLDVGFYGMGVAVADYDNDGWKDIFVSAVGQNHLFKNKNGKFEDVTKSAGVAGRDEDWGTSCGFFDYNNDGLLDLFVCNYVEWSAEFELALEVTLTGQIPGYVGPSKLPGVYPYLYRNDGEGKFTDVSKESMIQIDDPQNKRPLCKSLGLSFVDINEDGWQDVFVANDTVRNLLFVNNKNGTFSETGQTANIAYDDKGNARGAMGIDSAKFRSDDSIGFIIGNFAMEPASLYVKQGVIFTDESVGSGLGPETRKELTFGMFFFDYDLDGRLDILAANGHLEEQIDKKFRSQTYEQSPHLFWNAGEDQRTEFVTVDESRCGEDICKPMAGRGLSYGDIDNDGDLDVVITAVNSRPRILRNDQETGNHWLKVQLDGGEKNREGLGANVIVRCGKSKFHRIVSPTRSYLSQTQLPVCFGVGKAKRIDSIQVIWPDGKKQELFDLPSDRLLTIIREK